MFRRPTMFASLVLAFFVMAGLQAVWALAIALGYKTVSSALADYPGQLQVDPSGQLALEHYAQGKVYYQTTDGRPIDVPEFAYWLSGANLAAPLSERQRDRRLSWSERLTQVIAPTRPTVSWHLVHSATTDGTGYFIGYNDLSKMATGYIGRAGFRTVEPPSDQWFSIAGRRASFGVWYPMAIQKASGSPTTSEAFGRQGVVYLIADGRVWRIDLIGRTATVLYDSQDAVSLSTAAAVTEAPADQVPDDWHDGPYYILSRAGLLVRTPTEVIAVDLEGKQRTSWPIPPPLRRADFWWYELADGGALAAETRTDGDVYWQDFQWIDREGNITREEEVSIEPRPPASRRYWEMAAIMPQAFLMSATEAVVIPNFDVEHGLQPDFPAALAQTLSDGWSAWLAACVLSALLAWLAYRRQVRFALPGAGVWAAFVFLFGLPGWLAYRWHRRWPVLEACGECRRPAPRDRESCASCGQVFAPPPLVGTEVFA